MEINLTKTAQNAIGVVCDGALSHTFPLDELLPGPEADQIVLQDPVSFGTRLFETVFRAGTPAREVE